MLKPNGHPADMAGVSLTGFNLAGSTDAKGIGTLAMDLTVYLESFFF